MRFNKRGLRHFNNFKFELVRKGVTSGGSRLSFKYVRALPLTLKHKHLTTTVKSNAGRSSNGRIVVWTKKSRYFKRRNPNVNYRFRSKSISFVANISLLPFSHKLISLLFLSTGSVTYIPTNYSHNLFQLTRMYSVFTNIPNLRNKLGLISRFLFIKQDTFIIKFLPKNRPVSQLESIPGYGIKYVRSAGVSAKITKVDTKLNTALVKLPSGVRKVFSLFSLGTPNSNPIHENKYWKNNRAGYYSSFGKKPKVRGVAMNPVDHPHGGRTKTIAYPRTPWGKTTKYK